MSLINQVLNDLDKRGAAMPDAGGLVRAVPARPDLRKSVVRPAAGVMLVAALAGIVSTALDQPLAPPPVDTRRLAGPAGAAQASVSHATAAAMPEQPAASAAPPPVEVAATPPAVDLATEHPSRTQEGLDVAKRARPKREAGNKTASRPAVPPESAAGEGGGMKRVRPQQQADDEFNQALTLVQQGRKSEAQHHLETALQLNPRHGPARQALVALLLENRRTDDAERVLQEWLRHEPAQVEAAMLLARLQIEGGAPAQALDTLQAVSQYAGERADYQGFMAAVLQRQNRHEEAVVHYQTALKQAPDAGVWLMGLGISLQALKRNEEARAAYRRAIDTRSLGSELQAYVERRMKEL